MNRSRLLKIFASAMVLVACTTATFGQGVAISTTGTTSPDEDAALDIVTTTKGVLLPRLTTAQATTLAGNLEANDVGMMIYDTDLQRYKYWVWNAGVGSWRLVIANTAPLGFSMDEAYDAGGAGLGRTVTADEGPVVISGTGTGNGTDIGLETDGSIQLTTDDTWIGVGDAAERIVFEANDNEMSILGASGGVGIGTDAPNAILEVWDGPSTDPFLVKLVKNSNVASDLSGIGLGSEQSFHHVKSGIVHERESTNGVGKLHFLVDNVQDANDVSLAEARMTIDRDGRVGIGTTAPDRNLKVTGAGWTAVQIENTDNQDAALQITSQGVSSYVFTDNTGYLGVESGTGQDVVFNTNGPNEKMRIQSGGNVGIGTATPGALLHVDQTSGEAMIVENNGEADIRYIDNSSGQNWQTGTNSNGFYIYDSQYRVVVEPATGDVGVGTTTPGYRLHVDGGNEMVRNVETGFGRNNDPMFRGHGTGWTRMIFNGSMSMFTNGRGVTDDNADVHMDVNGVLQARKGLLTERRYGKYRRYQRGGGDEVWIGAWDYCAMGGMAARMDNDVYDSTCWDCWDSYTECEVQLAQAAYHAWSDDGGQTSDYGYGSRPNWDLRVYGYGPEDDVDVSCIAICVNFDY